MPIMDGLTATKTIRQMEQASVVNRKNETERTYRAHINTTGARKSRDGQQLSDSVGTTGYCCPKPHTPIIGVTASISEEDKTICLGAGMDDFVPKPIKRDLMLSVLNEWTTKNVVGCKCLRC